MFPDSQTSRTVAWHNLSTPDPKCFDFVLAGHSRSPLSSLWYGSCGSLPRPFTCDFCEIPALPVLAKEFLTPLLVKNNQPPRQGRSPCPLGSALDMRETQQGAGCRSAQPAILSVVPMRDRRSALSRSFAVWPDGYGEAAETTRCANPRRMNRLILPPPGAAALVRARSALPPFSNASDGASAKLVGSRWLVGQISTKSQRPCRTFVEFAGAESHGSLLKSPLSVGGVGRR